MCKFTCVQRGRIWKLPNALVWCVSFFFWSVFWRMSWRNFSTRMLLTVRCTVSQKTEFMVLPTVMCNVHGDICCDASQVLKYSRSIKEREKFGRFDHEASCGRGDTSVTTHQEYARCFFFPRGRTFSLCWTRVKNLISLLGTTNSKIFRE